MLTTIHRIGGRCQRGLSLVEMMVGIAIGLIVVAGATLLASTQIVENRRLVVDTQLQQDLRAAMDIVTRELRRAGTQRENTALTNISSENGSASQWNTYSQYLPPADFDICNGDVNCFDFAYEVKDQQIGPYGFKLTNGVIQTYLPGPGASQGKWQDLTDEKVLNVTAWSITERPQAAASHTQLPCPKLCPGGGTACWPSVRRRELEVTITAQDRTTGTVQRTMTSRVRLRNDLVGFYDSAAGQICPS